MGIARSSEIEAFLDDADEYEGGDLEPLVEERRARRQQAAKSRYATWRSVEDYMDSKRLKKALSEFYEEDFKD